MNDDTLDTTGDKVDLDGDGEADGLAYDDDGDGVYDWVQVDLDGDEYAETAIVDQDFDGEFDVVAVDADGDGVVDELYDARTGEVLDGGPVPTSAEETVPVPGSSTSGSEVVLDQTADEIDSDGDGVVDVFAYDDDGDGTYDYLEVDVDGDGVVDGAIVDEDFDGVFDTVLADEDGDGTIEVYDIETGEQIDEIVPEGSAGLPEEGLPSGDSPVNFPAGSPFQL